MASEFKYAWDRRTGEKLPYKVPETHFKIFKGTLSPTPLQKAKDAKRPMPTPRVPDVPVPVTEGEN